MKKILIVFGTRPEAIKMAPLVKQFQLNTVDFKPIVCVTGQHREMLDQVLEIFEIVPDYDLNIMKSGQDLYDITSRVILGLRDVISNEKPDVVLVHGDTTTSTTAALAAFYQKIPVGHIEAGLRTHNIYSPWPEELNRQLTSRIATYHFAPTQNSCDNLLNEGVKKNIFITGNTVIDALHIIVQKIKSPTLKNNITKSIKNLGYDIERINKGKQIILITGHRRENFGSGFYSICNAIKSLAIKYPNVDFIYPMHLNPNVRKPINEIFGKIKLENTFFIEPLEYLDFIYLMSNAYIVLTDSGGIQEEAPGLGKPVLVMRDTTERPEAVEAGTVLLVGTDENKIIEYTSKLLDDKNSYESMSHAINPYGDGHACERIIQALK